MGGNAGARACAGVEREQRAAHRAARAAGGFGGAYPTGRAVVKVSERRSRNRLECVLGVQGAEIEEGDTL